MIECPLTILDTDGPSKKEKKEEKRRAKAALIEETVQREYDERDRRETEKRHLLHEQKESQRRSIRERYEIPEGKRYKNKNKSSSCCFM